MPEAFLTLLFGLLGDFTFWCYKLCCTAVLLQCVRPWTSNERRLERKALWRKEQPVFWRMTFRAVAMLTGTHSSWFTTVEIEVLKCIYLGVPLLVCSPAKTLCACWGKCGISLKPKSGRRWETAGNVALEHAALGGQDISILGDLQDLTRRSQMWPELMVAVVILLWGGEWAGWPP